MKYIYMGIKDYCKDIAHDKALLRYFKYCSDIKIQDYNDFSDVWHRPVLWKEGSVWHYIKQRKLARKPIAREWVLEEYIKTKQDFIYYVWAALDEIASNGATYEWFVQECNYLCKIATKKGWLK